MGIKYTMVTSYLFSFTLKMAGLILASLLHYSFIAFHPQFFNLLIYPISYKENYPHPCSNGSIKRKKYMKMFLSVPVIHDPSNLPHVSSSIPIHTSLLSADHPRILRPPNNRQAQGHYVIDEQCIHIPANMITHCLRNNYIKLLIHYTLKTLLRRFPCVCTVRVCVPCV